MKTEMIALRLTLTIFNSLLNQQEFIWSLYYHFINLLCLLTSTVNMVTLMKQDKLEETTWILAQMYLKYYWLQPNMIEILSLTVSH